MPKLHPQKSASKLHPAVASSAFAAISNAAEAAKQASRFAFSAAKFAAEHAQTRTSAIELGRELRKEPRCAKIVPALI